jgi:hypothetical protein
MIKGLLAAATLAVLGSVAVPFASASGAEFVYIESNIKTPKGNSIYAYKRGEHGLLFAVAGSPFLTGGAGVQDSSLKLGPYDSDSQVITNGDQTLLFAVNSGSDSIAVFKIEEDGSLKAVDGSPFSSGGTDPVSLGLYRDTLIVVNQNSDFPRQSTTLPNYTSFRVSRNGWLTPIKDSTVSVAFGSSPSQALVAPNTNLLFGADFLGGLLQRFNINNDGYLRPRDPVALPPSEFDATTPRLPLGLAAHPVFPILYVGYVTANKLGVYRYNSYGHLDFLRTASNSGNGICWIRANRSGSRLYTTDTGTNQISVYDTSVAEEPREMQLVSLSGVGNAFQLALSGDGTSLYALSQRAGAAIPEGEGNVLHVLWVAGDGTLTENTDAAINFHFPAGVRPQGIATVSVQ